jgi:superfamily II DNA or RNA helicase
MNNNEKTFLSSRGYGLLKSEFSLELINKIKDELTVQPNIIMMNNELPNTYKIYQESSKKLYVPKYFGLKTFGKPDVNKVKEGLDINIKFNGELRESQNKPVLNFIKSCNDPLKMGGLINLECGGGKTIISLYLISVLQKKTLIIVHKDFLLKQWKERIEQFLPDAKVGLIKAQTIDIEDKDIVIGSLQSLSMKDYDVYVFNDFGFVIVDECHRIASEIFSRALYKINFKYSLGLSATINRKDGLSKVFKWHLGDIVFKNRKKNNVIVKEQPNVYIVEYIKDYVSDYNKEELMFNNKPNMSRMINNICNYNDRTRYIVDLILMIKNKDNKRNIIILSDRREHLRKIKDLVDNKNNEYIKKSGYYVGGMKEEELKKTEEECDIILATFSMAAEGLDIPKLNTLILASPKSDVQQSCGRILREKPEKRLYIPLIIDIFDNFSLFTNISNKRKKFYNKEKYNVFSVNYKNFKLN